MITPTKSVTTKWVDMPQAVACYAPAYIYALEKQWFKHSQSFGLMQQAAWQIIKFYLTNFHEAYPSYRTVSKNLSYIKLPS